jgi:hypothetical protein
MQSAATDFQQCLTLLGFIKIKIKYNNNLIKINNLYFQNYYNNFIKSLEKLIKKLTIKSKEFH